MKTAISLLVLFVAVQLVACSKRVASIEEVATNNRLWTGVAVSPSGRIFVNFPRWSDDTPVSVAEIDENGDAIPYPNAAMNSWQKGDDPSGKFVCIQSVYIDAIGRLWILDPADAWDEGVLPGGARLFEVDLSTDEVVRTVQFDDEIATQMTYLNDVRVDTNTNTAFITDAYSGAIIVVDLETNTARRVLDSHSSTKPEDIEVIVGGIMFDDPVAADGIALDTNGGWLYYQALTGRTLYRVPTATLRDPSLSDSEVGERVERVAQSGVSDGLLFTHDGIYVSALEEDSIKRVDKDGNVTTIVTDPRILWPDSFALDSNGSVVFTTSQIHLENPSEPYRILRIVTD